MRITPLDIQQKKFSRRLKGYALDDVASFLELLGEEISELTKENTSLKDELKELSKQLKKYTDLESAMRETLISSIAAFESYKTNAKKDSDQLLDEAGERAKEILQGAQLDITGIHDEINSLQNIRKQFKEKVRMLVEESLHKCEGQ